MLLKLVISIDLVSLLIDCCNFEDIFDGIYKYKKFMSTQNSQRHKRQDQNNTEWLDELINKIENMKKQNI
tara:strand:+ start:30 stop:239 length:210 start_codon:yes stop_codon:yes gene_type:complete